MRIQVVAPTRADFAGGTLDLWPLFCFEGEAKTINFALDLYAKVTLEVSRSKKVALEVTNGKEATTLTELDEDLVHVSPAIRFPATLAQRFLRQFAPEFVGMMHLQFSTNAPQRSGLGGSSALAVAVTHAMATALDVFKGSDWRWRLLAWVRDAEGFFLRTPTGTQDYLAALFGGAHTFISRWGEWSAIGLPKPLLSQLDERALILFSGEMHDSGLSNWDIYRGAIEGDSSIRNGLHGIAEVAHHVDALLRKSSIDWKAVGKAISREWQIRKETFKVNTAKLDEIEAFIRKQEILGAKVCGAAQGGSFVVLVDPSARKRVKQACTERGIQVLETRPSVVGVTAKRSALKPNR